MIRKVADGYVMRMESRYIPAKELSAETAAIDSKLAKQSLSHKLELK